MIILSKVLPFFFMLLGVTTALVLAGIVFRRRLLCLAGLGVVPYPVDFQVSQGKKRSVMDFLPQAGALRNTEQ